MMREQERRTNEEDPTEEIVVGKINNKTFDPESQQQISEQTGTTNFAAQPVDVADAEIRLYEHNEQPIKKKPLLQS